MESIISNITLESIYRGIAFFALLSIIFKIVHKYLINRILKLTKKTKSDVDDQIVVIINSIKPPMYYLLSLFIALYTLSLPQNIKGIINSALIIILLYQAVVSLNLIIEFLAHRYLAKNGNENQKDSIRILTNIIKGTLWLIALLLFLQNRGVNISSLIAGLGVGGVAVAFALQNILEDLFSSFAIIFDKPFEQGDFIIIGNYMGTVEKIGIKTTRIRAIQGEELVVSNKELTSTKIQNFKKMKDRRVSFNIGVTYDTPNEKMQKIPSMIGKIIKKQKKVRFDRAHFVEFGDFSLNFEIVYFVNSANYEVYLDINQKILLDIKQTFEKEKIDISFPTQNVILKKD